jgi:hypothetical protein
VRHKGSHRAFGKGVQRAVTMRILTRFTNRRLEDYAKKGIVADRSKMKVCVIRSYKRLQIGTDIRCRVLHKPVVLVLQRCSGILLCQDLVLSSVTTEVTPVSASHVNGIAGV